MTLTLELDLDILPLDLHTEIQVCMSIRLAVRVRRTHTQTHTQTMSKLLHPTRHSVTWGVIIIIWIMHQIHAPILFFCLTIILYCSVQSNDLGLPGFEYSIQFEKKKIYTFRIFENERIGTKVGEVFCMVTASDQFLRLTYSFSGDDDALENFAIDPESGVITTKKVLDREAAYTYTFTVEAHNVPVVDENINVHDVATVTVYVSDQNDNSPEWIFPNEHNNTIYVPSGTLPGMVIGHLQADDSDTWQYPGLRYVNQ